MNVTTQYMKVANVPEYNVVLACDPGSANIGIAVRIHGLYDTCKGAVPEDLYQFFNNSIDLVIIEDFQAETISKYGISTIQIIGGAKALCWKMGIPIRVQQPQFRRAFIDDAKNIRRRLNKEQHRVGLDGHECDALAHLLAFEYHMESKSG